MSADDIPSLKIMALGRPFKVGMLYDFKTDKLIPNMLLWDDELISKHLICQSSLSNCIDIHISNTFTEKADLLGIDNNLKLSVLAGLVDLSGSAKLIDYCQTTEQKIQFILQYSITTHFHELPKHCLTKRDIKHQEIFNQENATHVVTDILYGAEIFLIFNRKLSDNENRTEVQNSVQDLLKKTRTLQIFDNDQLDLNNDEKKLADTLTCKYYGDIQLKSNPTSFKDAVKLIKQLPNLLGKNNQNTIQKKVLIYPLYLLDDFISSTKRYHEIDDHILSKSVQLMDSLYQLKINFSRIKNSLSSLKVFYRTERQLSTFVTRMTEIKSDIRRQMIKLLPKIRGKSVEEKALTHLLKNLDWSSLSKQKINNWIQIKTDEINIFTKFINDLRKQNNIQLLTSSFSKLQKNFNCELILCLIIHVTQKNDRFLNEFFQYLDGSFKQQNDTDNKIDCWFNQNKLVLIQKEIAQFIKFAKNNINKQNVKFIVDEQYIDEFEMKKGVTITLYQNGVPINFKIPSKPGRPYATDASCQNTTLSWTQPADGGESIQQYEIYGQSNLNQQWKLLFTTVDATQSAILSNLVVGKYQFKVQGITLAGYTSESDASNIIGQYILSFIV
jgi:hypothetical protein